MTKEDFVSLECAKLLKEKGFDEPCLGTWLKNGEFRRYDVEQRLVNMMSIGDDYYEFLAPTLYEAHKWLRNNYFINIPIKAYSKNDWGIEIEKILTQTIKHIHLRYTSYESALEAGIIEALKLI